MALENILRNIDLSWIKNEFFIKGEGWKRKWADGGNIMNADRVKSVGDSLLLYVFNHQTQLDYFVPCYAILKEQLPYPRPIVGSNLDNFFVRRLMWDFAKWGAIWHNRRDESVKTKRQYINRVTGAFLDGHSVLGFPEGTRNRELAGAPREFKEGFFRVALYAQNQLLHHGIDKDIVIVCGACRYENIHERNYFDKIDRRGFETFSYYAWDLWVYLRWIRFEKQKGVAKINFYAPIALKDFLGNVKDKSSQKEAVKTMAQETRLIICDLLREM